MLIGLVVCFGWYFYCTLSAILPTPAAVDVMPHQIVLFAVAVVFLTVTQVAGHCLLAIVDRRTETDERDRLYELQGTRNAAYVLATGVFFALWTAVATKGNFLFTHVLLAFWVLAQLVEIVSQLWLYRRSA
jgi:hypothetical protein